MQDTEWGKLHGIYSTHGLEAQALITHQWSIDWHRIIHDISITMDIYQLETVHGRLQEEGHTVLYKWPTNGVQIDITSVYYLAHLCIPNKNQQPLILFSR